MAFVEHQTLPADANVRAAEKQAAHLQRSTIACSRGRIALRSVGTLGQTKRGDAHICRVQREDYARWRRGGSDFVSGLPAFRWTQKGA